MATNRIAVQEMELAVRNIEKSIAIDSAAPSLLNLMNINSNSLITASGLTDHDYPVFCGAQVNMDIFKQIKVLKKTSLPPEIVEHFGHIQCHSMMGLFPEISRAWLIIDSDIYLWTYDNVDLAYFDGINETILCVGLIKPKIGVFHDFIKYLLVITTAVDIVVLGVSLSNDMINLLPDPVFTLPTDGATISTIVGTKNGRLFLGCKEGNLYEIIYQAESSWFGKRCKKVNLSTSTLSFLVPSFLNAALTEDDSVVQIVVDNSRHILYVLTEKGSIEVYDLGFDGTGFSKVSKITQNTLIYQAVNIVKTLDSQNFFPIVSISPIELSESTHLYLVAVTLTGVRFYLTTHSLNASTTNQRPYTLFLAHVRLPPGYSANVTVRPRAVHMAHYSDRNLILLSTVNEKDVIWCISSDLFPFSQHLMEIFTTINLDSAALAMAEIYIPSELDGLTQDSSPLIIKQHSQPAKQYVVLTSDGIYMIAKLRPVDILLQLLVDSCGHNSEIVKHFFIMQKEDQACATSLIISSLHDDLEIADYATRAYFMFGNEPKVIPLPNRLNITFSPNIMSTPGPQLNLQQSTLNQTFSQTLPYYTNCEGPFIFSSKHNGLYLYLGRILRPIWNQKCVDKLYVDPKTFVIISTISCDHAHYLLTYLNSLKKFITINTHLSFGGDTTNNNNNNNNNNNETTKQENLTNTTINRMEHTIQDAQIEERYSLSSFKIFIENCCQILGLWKILCEHQFHLLIDTLSEPLQANLLSITFKDLFLFGQDICTSLLTILIESYLNDDASIDAISLKLREICPNFYKNEDATFSKAFEILKLVKNKQNIDEKEDLISNALQLCKSVAPNVNIKEICKQLISVKAYVAVIDLCITYAKKIDPDNIGGYYYKNELSGVDQDGRNYYLKRMMIYNEILTMLDTIQNEELQNKLNQTNNLNNSNNNSNDLINQLIIDVLEYPDDVLHVALYEWMSNKNMHNDLQKIENPSLETFLIKSSKQSDNILLNDLLWKYYENNGKHANAAKVLDDLSSKTNQSISITTRIEYLSRAIICMRSDKAGYGPSLGVFLRDLEDKLEVALIQKQIYDNVKLLKGIDPGADSALIALNSELFNISQLYENFAEPLNLLECKLKIIDTAGYNDKVLIEQIWRKLLKMELQNSKGNGNDRMLQILNKIKILSSQHGIKTPSFQLSFLLNELEQLAAYLKADENLVPETFISIGYDFKSLIESYNKLIVLTGDINIYQKQGNEYHIFKSIIKLMNCFLSKHHELTNNEKRAVIAYFQDTLASILSILYSKPNTNNLVNEYRIIQTKLSRI